MKTAQPIMFRPYSLRSIAAWTAGAYAGNVAYYKAKSRGSRLAKAAFPPEVRAIMSRLTAIEEQAKALARAVPDICPTANESQFPNSGPQGNEFNLTPMIRVFAYNEWLQKEVQRIKPEIRKVYEASMAAGYVYSSSVISDAQSAFQSLADQVSTIARDLKEIHDTMLADISDPAVREKLRQLIDQSKGFCAVDESSCRLTIIDPRRLLVNLQLKAT